MKQATLAFGQKPRVLPHAHEAQPRCVGMLDAVRREEEVLEVGTAGTVSITLKASNHVAVSNAAKDAVDMGEKVTMNAVAPPKNGHRSAQQNGEKACGVFAKPSEQVKAAQAATTEAPRTESIHRETATPVQVIDSNDNAVPSAKARGRAKAVAAKGLKTFWRKVAAPISIDASDDDGEDLTVTGFKMGTKRAKQAGGVIDLTRSEDHVASHKASNVIRPPKLPLPPFPNRESIHVHPTEEATFCEANDRYSLPFERRTRLQQGTSTIIQPDQPEPLLAPFKKQVSDAMQKVRQKRDARFEPIYLDLDGNEVVRSSYVSPPLPIDISSIASDSALMQHAAMQRVVEAAAANTSSVLQSTDELLTDRWRPLHPNECLGNEAQAAYLSDWLRALQVSESVSTNTEQKLQPQAHSQLQPGLAQLPMDSSPVVTLRKRKVQRRIEKIDSRKKRQCRLHSDSEDDDGMDGWLARDSETEEEQEVMLEQINTPKINTFFGKFKPKSRDANGESLSSPSPTETATQETNQSDVTAASSMQSGVTENTTLTRSHAAVLGPHRSFADSNILTNCIVLHGPTGCGKTAMVYACAAEMGYEVFELFPGMGKRSGVALEAAVGDLARNHMVLGGGKGGGATFKSKSVLDLMRKRNDASPQKPAPASFARAGSAQQPARQSVILIEEGDVLFEEDKGFWQAVVELVAKSQRPVVITCNDIAQVPLQTLPIQEVLEVTAPPRNLLSAYLKVVAAAEGKELDDATRERTLDDAPLLKLAEKDQRTLPADGAVAPGSEIPDATPSKGGEAVKGCTADLRQALLQLHYWCHSSGAHHGLNLGAAPAPCKLEAFTQDESGDDMQDVARCREQASFADAELQLGIDHHIEVILGEGNHSAADKLSLRHGKMLSDAEAEKFRPILPHYGRQDQIYDALSSSRAAALSRAPSPLGFQDAALLQGRVEFSRRLACVLQGLRVHVLQLPPRRAAALDYAPYVAAMQDHDDGCAAAAASAAASLDTADGMGSSGTGSGLLAPPWMRTRPTRNSMRLRHAESEYVRWLPLNMAGMEEARKLAMRYPCVAASGEAGDGLNVAHAEIDAGAPAVPAAAHLGSASQGLQEPDVTEESACMG